MSASDNVAQLEHLLGRQFSGEEAAAIQQWQNGRALAHIRNFEGFEVILAMLQDYVLNATNQLLTTDPKDVDEVRGAHAAVHALNRLLVIFVQDVDAAIEASRNTPDPIVEASKQVKTPAPPESL